MGRFECCKAKLWEGGIAVGIIVALLIIWVVISVLGFVIKGLFWLAVIGIVLFVATAAVGWFRNRGSIRS